MRSQIYRTQPNIEVVHKDEVLSFAANIFQKKTFMVEEDNETSSGIFEHINRYWAGLPTGDQDAIFSIYESVYNAFDQIHNGEELSDHLRRCIIDLIYFHPQDRLRMWLAQDASIIIPDSIPAEFEPSPDGKNTRAKTYTKAEYMDLISLAMFFRTLMPIWGQYTNTARDSYGIEFKEYAALQLLRDTGVLEYPTMEKLSVYVKLIATDKYKSKDKILNSVSTEDINFILLAMVCVRRLCIGDLHGADSKTHVVSKIHKFLLQRVFNSQENESDIRFKVFQKDLSADNTKRSILESYRKRAELNPGEQMEITSSYSDPLAIAQSFAPEISFQELDETLTYVHHGKNERFGNTQLNLLAKTFKRDFSPNSGFYIPKDILVNALGILECVLWHWGHKYLALLATSYQIVSYGEMMVTPVATRSQIPDDLKQKIRDLYPFVWSSIKRNTGELVQEPHPVLTEIDMGLDELTEHAWRMTAAPQRIFEVFHEDRRRLTIPSDIKTYFAQLAVDVEARIKPL